MANIKVIAINDDENEQALEQVTDSSTQDYDFNQLIAKAKSADPNVSVSFWDIFKYISKIGIPMSLSFTFSFEVFASVLLLQLVSKSEDDTAAATLVSTLMNTLCVISMCPLLSVVNVLSGKLGELRAKDAALSPTALKTFADEEEDEYADLFVIIDTSSGETLERSDLREQIESIGPYAFLMGTLLTFPCWASLYFSRAIMTTVFHQQDSVALSAERFLRPYSFAVPALLFRVIFGMMMFGFGKNTQAMGLALTTFGVGLAIAILLGFGFSIFPELDQTGIALGFVLETYLTSLFYGLFVKFDRDCQEFNFFQMSWKILGRNTQVFIEMLRFGGAFLVSYGIDLSLTLAVGIFSGILGVEEQSAMSYCMQFIYFEFIFLAAFSMACMQEVTRAMGVKNAQTEQRHIAQIAEFTVQLSRGGLITSLIYLTPFPLLVAAYPKALELVSGGASQEVSRQLRTLVPIMSVGVICDSVRYNLLQQTRAFNDLTIPIVIAFFGMSSGIIFAALFGFAASLGIDGIAMGYAIGLGLTAIALFLRWRSLCNTAITESEPANQTLMPRPGTAQGSSSNWMNSITAFFGGSSEGAGRSTSMYPEATVRTLNTQTPAQDSSWLKSINSLLGGSVEGTSRSASTYSEKTGSSFVQMPSYS